MEEKNFKNETTAPNTVENNTKNGTEEKVIPRRQAELDGFDKEWALSGGKLIAGGRTPEHEEFIKKRKQEKFKKENEIIEVEVDAKMKIKKELTEKARKIEEATAKLEEMVDKLGGKEGVKNILADLEKTNPEQFRELVVRDLMNKEDNFEGTLKYLFSKEFKLLMKKTREEYEIGPEETKDLRNKISEKKKNEKGNARIKRLNDLHGNRW